MTLVPKDERAHAIRAAMVLYLGREPDLPGLISYYYGELDPEEIARDIRASDERRQKIKDAFINMLGRQPTEREHAYWCDSLLSPERVVLELTYHDDRVVLVEAMQQEILGFTEGAAVVADQPRYLSKIRAELLALSAQWADRDLP